MKNDEIDFFLTCFVSRMLFNADIRSVIDDIVLEGKIPYKRCLYLIEKWSRKGFYEWGVSIDLGWFSDDIDDYPEPYANLLRELHSSFNEKKEELNYGRTSI